jgi:hypothetical protein
VSGMRATGNLHHQDEKVSESNDPGEDALLVRRAQEKRSDFEQLYDRYAGSPAGLVIEA